MLAPTKTAKPQPMLIRSQPPPVAECLLQHNVGDDTRTEQDQPRGAQQFPEKYLAEVQIHDHSFALKGRRAVGLRVGRRCLP